LSHEVRTHTRTVNGKTVTVRQHQSEDPATAQRKRHAFELRVQRERQRAETQLLRERQLGEALYPKPVPKPPRPPGERKRKRRMRGPKPARAKRHAVKAVRLWRRHKVKAALFAGLALGEITAWAAWRGTAKILNVTRKLLPKRKKRRKR
jgi:hypothetical protein